MELGKLVEHLMQYYERVTLHRNELGQAIIYVTKDGVTVTLIVERTLKVVK